MQLLDVYHSLKEFGQIFISFENILFSGIQSRNMRFCPNVIHRNGGKMDVHISIRGPINTASM